MLAGQTLSGFLSARFGWRFFFKLVPVLGLFTLFFLSRSFSPPHSRAEVTLPRRGEADRARQARSTAARQAHITVARRLRPGRAVLAARALQPAA